jgi:hypothetical protein
VCNGTSGDEEVLGVGDTVELGEDLDLLTTRKEEGYRDTRDSCHLCNATDAMVCVSVRNARSDSSVRGGTDVVDDAHEFVEQTLWQ